ncbi:hypothetical protein CYMTET_53603 [Cymbomonas tetramitiformis]|uniref:Uncharacterized protein n=1 Tax=Cymbomonas tetramitiformis TaxID=36881 RepID=A0AAE0EQ66_9CHLO|nr:hypothetical protein CYMTET_53603 [Cymbomonas tetramitiformis]
MGTRRDGGGEVTVAEVDGWSAEAERDLLAGWRLLDQTGSGSAGVEHEADGAGVGEAGGPFGPLGGTLGGVGGLVQSEGGGRQVREGQQAGTVVCSVPGAVGSSFLRLDCASTALAVEVVKMSMLSVVHQLKREKGEKKGVTQVIKERCARFLRGDWEELHAEAPGDRRATAEADEERVLRDAVRLVKAGQLGKAAKRLELAKLAPATDETLQMLERMHPAGTGRRREVGEDRRRELQAQALELDEGVRAEFPELWAWTNLCYGVEANLGFRLGGADGSVVRFV